jgi:hypothetical protein
LTEIKIGGKSTKTKTKVLKSAPSEFQNLNKMQGCRLNLERQLEKYLPGANPRYITLPVYQRCWRN